MGNDKESNNQEPIDLFPIEKAISLLKAIFITAALVVLAYFVWFRGSGYGGPDAWGQFGDYVGGLLNPILSFFALIVLVVSLRASIRALQQNEKVLELTKNELILTRQQIEDTEKALKKQTDIVHTNAHAERIGKYAEKVYEEIVWHRDTKKTRARIFRGQDAAFPIFSAFDMPGKHFSNVKKRNEWSDKKWENLPRDNGLKVIPSLFEELVELCRLSSKTCNTEEMSRYYWNRLRRWFLGAHRLGYIDLKELLKLDI